MPRLRRYKSALVFTAILVFVAFHFGLIRDSDSFLNVQNNSRQAKFLEGIESSAPYNSEQPVKAELLLTQASEDIEALFSTETTHKKITLTQAFQATPRPDLLSGTDEIPIRPPKPHWKKFPENYPVPLELLIKLPAPNYIHFPRVQASFPEERQVRKQIRLRRRDAVKEAFAHSWNGYKKHAWGHDEVRPITGGVRDPFMGWGATLVDALDTLWIMGLVEEFEEAVEAVKRIDFTTSVNHQIPVFETTIRYLGGLLGAYDISHMKYTVLLEKAVQLADVLYGAFDTPNRMPILYYQWRPDQAKRPKQATQSSLAEIGTLALEFTRLAQLTGNHSYFDAIQRITNALEEIQMQTSLPGMWPINLDTSPQCQLPPGPITVHKNRASDKSERGRQEKPMVISEQDSLQDIPHRQLEYYKPHSPNSEAISKTMEDRPTPTPCIPKNIAVRRYGVQKFTFGAMADSLYEYLIKMHILLGGSTDQYKRMYITAMNAGRKLFYRPMVKNNANVLLSGDITIDHDISNFNPDSGHLTCFTGGMVALGGQILSLKTDVELGIKLANGCVWVYDHMKTGLMPEYVSFVKCDGAEDCEWDQKKWLGEIIHRLRPRVLRPRRRPYDVSTTGYKEEYEHQHKASASETQQSYGKQQEPKSSDVQSNEGPSNEGPYSIDQDEMTEEPGYDEYPPELAPGFRSIRDKRYLLRPEAIESVFIMYRITADSSWQEKGWKMFEATNKTARTKIAYAAIADVTRDPDEGVERLQTDSMESFWLAETLKYYYLLFSEPSFVSLDEFVFNTEAHPFLRPKLDM